MIAALLLPPWGRAAAGVWAMIAVAAGSVGLDASVAIRYGLGAGDWVAAAILVVFPAGYLLAASALLRRPSAGLGLDLYRTLAVAALGAGGPPQDAGWTVRYIISDRLADNLVDLLLLPGHRNRRTGRRRSHRPAPQQVICTDAAGPVHLGLIAEMADEQSEIADACVTLCGNAGVAASDVICCAHLGEYPYGEDRNEAVELLSKADARSASSCGCCWP